MNKILKHIPLLALLVATPVLNTGCQLFNGQISQGDIALLAEDLRDVAREGTIYALAENAAWRPHIVTVRDQLKLLAAEPNLTIGSLRNVLQGLPIQDLKSSEARLAISGGKIILRRVGRNIDLGNVQNIQPLAAGLAAGMTEALDTR